jgi:hypothetical protein
LESWQKLVAIAKRDVLAPITMDVAEQRMRIASASQTSTLQGKPT